MVATSYHSKKRGIVQSLAKELLSEHSNKHAVINTITSPELWAYASRVKTGNDMRQRLNQGHASLHGLCTFLFVSEGQVVNARLEGVAA